MSRRKSSRYNKSSPSTDNNNNNSNLSPNTNSGKKKKKRISKKQREENARANQIKNERSTSNVVQWPPPVQNAPQYSPLCIPSQTKNEISDRNKNNNNNNNNKKIGGKKKKRNKRTMIIDDDDDDDDDDNNNNNNTSNDNAEKHSDETKNLLENDGLFLIQLPPLPHVKAIFNGNTTDRNNNNNNSKKNEANNNNNMKNGNSNNDLNDNNNKSKGKGGRSRAKSENQNDTNNGVKDEQAQFVGQGATKISSGNEQFLNQLPSGNMGKLRRYKSGKMELVIGQYVFDVTKGPSVHTYREMVHIDVKNGQFERMGDIQERLIVSPNIELLLEKNMSMVTRTTNKNSGRLNVF